MKRNSLIILAFLVLGVMVVGFVIWKNSEKKEETPSNKDKHNMHNDDIETTLENENETDIDEEQHFQDEETYIDDQEDHQGTFIEQQYSGGMHGSMYGGNDEGTQV